MEYIFETTISVRVEAENIRDARSKARTVFADETAGDAFEDGMQRLMIDMRSKSDAQPQSPASPNPEAAPYFVLWREGVPNSPMVKEGDFFREQGGLTQEWGRNWEPINASSIGDARRKIAARHGFELSHIYAGEQ